jgi:hypothetical protein
MFPWGEQEFIDAMTDDLLYGQGWFFQAERGAGDAVVSLRWLRPCRCTEPGVPAVTGDDGRCVFCEGIYVPY